MVRHKLTNIKSKTQSRIKCQAAKEPKHKEMVKDTKNHKGFSREMWQNEGDCVILDI